ncbi:sigma factor-like helix-turn-helix DNA-binding protein [Algisphaera agarilytica]|uniref:DNA-directed RNA polymerase specialized sigma24 family protein n=1 Tax=Algisphaera agarilytica TaxID=1385975 RepID=A0A7X0LLJ8_9BACT|nr:sigma factor-like helix-turn-helix DNA-binding protein [Algisphaera agarilytica]MBB6430711.1 DNA-directed RNA polymerase specialized sigma24 family protein [Algisphaera agarilytica]
MSSTEAACVKKCLNALERIERYVVLMFFADELTPAEIGVVLDVSLRRVTDILDRFREAVAHVLTRNDQQRDAQAYVANWLLSPHSAVV